MGDHPIETTPYSITVNCLLFNGAAVLLCSAVPYMGRRTVKVMRSFW